MEQVEKEINGRLYLLTPFGAKKSLELTSKITSMLDLKVEKEGVNEYSLLTSIVGNSSFISVVEELCKEVMCEGRKINFDTHFRDNKKDLFGVVGMSLKENVMPFFDPTALETLFESLGNE